MNMETVNENINSIKNIAKERKTKVIEGDILVPDIKPDILSLISIENEVYIKSYNVAKDNVLINGTMEINVLYISEDENGSIKSLSNEFEFSENFDIPGATDESIVNLNFQKGNVDSKIINARKISFKSNINLTVDVNNNSMQNVVKDVLDEKNVEMQKNNIEMQSFMIVKKKILK